jgi:hypothetical protein
VVHDLGVGGKQRLIIKRRVTDKHLGPFEDVRRERGESLCSAWRLNVVRQ